ncbi:hypothetical protein [Lactobacillus delbrueckii]|uniref:hypothetical protein n=1 Tax=Lactobacillus delbrueckii TaxID=1584 RepID=UPI00399197B6
MKTNIAVYSMIPYSGHILGIDIGTKNLSDITDPVYYRLYQVISQNEVSADLLDSALEHLRHRQIYGESDNLPLFVTPRFDPLDQLDREFYQEISQTGVPNISNPLEHCVEIQAALRNQEDFYHKYAKKISKWSKDFSKKRKEMGYVAEPTSGVMVLKDCELSKNILFEENIPIWTLNHVGAVEIGLTEFELANKICQEKRGSSSPLKKLGGFFRHK